MQVRVAAVPGAKLEVCVTTPDHRYLGACMLESLARRTSSCIVVPLTWLHWVVVALEPDATAATLRAARDLVEQLRANLAVPADVWVPPTYAGWMPGQAAGAVPRSTAALPL